MSDITSEKNKFYNLSEQDIINIINTAKHHIIYAKPAYFMNEATAITEAVNNGVQCDLYFDYSEEAIRAGYGDKEALEMLWTNENLVKHGVTRVRQAILIVDGVTIVFAPILKSLEKNHVSDFPNAIVCGDELSTNIQALLNVSNLNQIASNYIDNENLNIVLNTKETIKKVEPNDVVANKEIGKTLESLKDNPPVKAERLHEIDIYRNNFKIMKFTKLGIDITSKVVSLNKFYDEIGLRPENAKNSWQVIPHNQTDNLCQMKDFQRELDKTLNSYKDNGDLFDAGRHGWLVRVGSILIIQKEIEKIIDTYKKEIGDPESSEIGRAICDSKDSLVNYLSAYCLRYYDKYSNSIKQTVGYLTDKKDEDAKKQLTDAYVRFVIQKVLRYPKASDIINKINVKYDFYDISNELLENKEFSAFLKKNDIIPRNYNKAYEKV